MRIFFRDIILTFLLMAAIGREQPRFQYTIEKGFRIKISEHLLVTVLIIFECNLFALRYRKVKVRIVC